MTTTTNSEDLLTTTSQTANGQFETDDEGIEWYRIDDYDHLDPFLINVVTSDDQWIYVSSSGALTAGRRSSEHAIFQYQTDDRLHRSGGRTGPLTMILVPSNGAAWQPFSPLVPYGQVQRSLKKSVIGNRLHFQEYHPDLGLTFRATLAAAGPLGLVRQCELVLDDDRQPLEVHFVDGLLDVLPGGVELGTQQTASTLVDAYRRSEFNTEAQLATFSLEALISDRADPAESLTASVVWTAGLDDSTVVLSDRQLRRFRSGETVDSEHLVTGRKGSFLVSAKETIEPGKTVRWLFGADVDKDHVSLLELRKRLMTTTDLWAAADLEIDAASDQLTDIVAAADGLQLTADRRATAHHFANTLFNCMRGGVLLNDHRVDLGRLDRFVANRNRVASKRLAAATAGLEQTVDIEVLRSTVEQDADLTRLVSEYLPLSFSRRHGDPSRPWNTFHIPKSTPGKPLTEGYEGNWRDIFQNWDALLHSFPNYLPSVIGKFLSASTLDGHNPYRITEEGIDWEIPEAGSWGNFGYWGDHQIVYLHRLLDAANRFHPGWLEASMSARNYSYGDVPYRLRPYQDLVADPKKTLVFDEARQADVDRRVEHIGADGRLVPISGGNDAFSVHHASLAEKLIVPALAKLSHLVAGAGIWLNTQRPEWNDANNALVGNGVSTVTLLHLRDYLLMLDSLLAGVDRPMPIGSPVMAWLNDLEEAFGAHSPSIPIDQTGDVERRDLLDSIGGAFERYRNEVYQHGPGQTVAVTGETLRRFLAVTRPHLDHAAESARRPDGLFHTYWLLGLDSGTAALTPLFEMLEGQAAALSGFVDEDEMALRLIDSLFESELYRPDQKSFILYPNRRPPRFVDKNRIPDDEIGPAITRLLSTETGIVNRAVDGSVRFAAELQSGRHLDAALNELAAGDDRRAAVDETARAEIVAAYESVFNHRAFTGRSQTMYRYEGLGSIYWHMVSKLLYALQEHLISSADSAANRETVEALAKRYWQVRAGLGFMKSVEEQGSFPTDPHSHTPADAGAQQPGMTGQVKEGVLIRFGELGVIVEAGKVRFRPVLLDPAEFLTEPQRWTLGGTDLVLEPGTFGFVYCAVPVVYRRADTAWTTVHWAGGRSVDSDGPELDRQTSRALFRRTGEISRIDVGVVENRLWFGSGR